MADVNKPHAVAPLIDAVKDANRWSDTDIVDRASKQGHAMSKSNISRLRLQAIMSLSGDQVRALAAGLDLPVRQVVAAFLTSMALPVGDEPSSVEAALRSELYPENVRRMVLQVLAASASVDFVRPGPVDLKYVTPEGSHGFVEIKDTSAKVHQLRDPVKELERLDREASGEVPPVPEDVAARDEGGPSMGEQLRAAQDADSEAGDGGGDER
jgi:hypothetical protein